MSLEIWLPQSARPAYRCNVRGCDLTFTEHELNAYITHCAAHSAQEEASIASEIEDRDRNAFTGRSLDTEREAHLRRRQHAGEKVDWWKEGVVH